MLFSSQLKLHSKMPFPSVKRNASFKRNASSNILQNKILTLFPGSVHERLNILDTLHKKCYITSTWFLHNDEKNLSAYVYMIFRKTYMINKQTNKEKKKRHNTWQGINEKIMMLPLGEVVLIFMFYVGTYTVHYR